MYLVCSEKKDCCRVPNQLNFWFNSWLYLAWGRWPLDVLRRGRFGGNCCRLGWPAASWEGDLVEFGGWFGGNLE